MAESDENQKTRLSSSGSEAVIEHKVGFLHNIFGSTNIVDRRFTKFYKLRKDHVLVPPANEKAES